VLYLIIQKKNKKDNSFVIFTINILISKDKKAKRKIIQAIQWGIGV